MRYGVVHERADHELAVAVELDIFHQNLTNALQNAADNLTFNQRRPSLPDIQYVALRRTGGKSALVEAIADLAVECCDFSQMFQDLLS